MRYLIIKYIFIDLLTRSLAFVDLAKYHYIILQSDSSETKKHSLVEDEELISIKRRQWMWDHPSVDVKSVIKNKYVLKWNFEEDGRPARVVYVVFFSNVFIKLVTI
nr:15272_t:CDS:2 [Entrophospora candida]